MIRSVLNYATLARTFVNVPGFQKASSTSKRLPLLKTLPPSGWEWNRFLAILFGSQDFVKAFSKFFLLRSAAMLFTERLHPRATVIKVNRGARCKSVALFTRRPFCLQNHRRRLAPSVGYPCGRYSPTDSHRNADSFGLRTWLPLS